MFMICSGCRSEYSGFGPVCGVCKKAGIKPKKMFRSTERTRRWRARYRDRARANMLEYMRKYRRA